MEAHEAPGEGATSGQNDPASRLRAWRAASWSFWTAHGLDERGLFFERVGFDGAPDRTSDRRVLVQGRQLFSLGRAAAAGWPKAREVLQAACPAIAAHAWAVDGAPGWIHVLAGDGSARDRMRDLYDQSFLLLGLAEASRAGVDGADALGAATWSFVDTLRNPETGGFLEGRPPTLPRRSNPHMHLMEAALAWFDLTGEARHLATADAIADLFARHFFDRERSTLAEFFDARLHRIEDARGDSVEPGHMFEWSWLLHRLARAGGRDLREAAAALHEWACAHGCDAAGFAVDEVDRDGRVRRATRRAWPQTELIKSAVANDDLDRAVQTASRYLDTYLATDLEGLWIDQFDASSCPMSSVVPASTLYHIIVAFEELLEALAGAGRFQT